MCITQFPLSTTHPTRENAIREQWIIHSFSLVSHLGKLTSSGGTDLAKGTQHSDRARTQTS